jgi:hypothetical protein
MELQLKYQSVCVQFGGTSCELRMEGESNKEHFLEQAQANLDLILQGEWMWNVR